MSGFRRLGEKWPCGQGVHLKAGFYASCSRCGGCTPNDLCACCQAARTPVVTHCQHMWGAHDCCLPVHESGPHECACGASVLPT